MTGLFRKVLFVFMFATAVGFCLASDNIPQVVTSEVIYKNKILV